MCINYDVKFIKGKMSALAMAWSRSADGRRMAGARSADGRPDGGRTADGRRSGGGKTKQCLTKSGRIVMFVFVTIF